MSPSSFLNPAGWGLSPGLALFTLATALVYLRGWRRLRRQMPERFPPARLACFLAGQATLLIALASPLDGLGGLLLTAHMAQHLLLQVVAPPLLLLGAPAMPLLRGLPAGVAREALGPFLASAALRRAFATLTHPLVGLTLASVAMWLWHVPGAYQLALRSPAWHAVEHLAFLLGGLAFWWSVVQPWPARPRAPAWLLPPLLLLADVQNTVLAAILVFSGRVLYPAYEEVPRLFGLSALEDQALAGALMWVATSVIYLTPAVFLTWRLLAPAGLRRHRTVALEVVPERDPARRRADRGGGAPFDLLRLPLLGPALRSPALRAGVRTSLFVGALAIVADGFLGPSMAPMNLAGVLPWTHWRGLTILTLLVVGNLFCASCPFTLARDLARRRVQPRRPWPRALRSKWLPAGLVVAFLVIYEALAPWDGPRLTACLVLGYLVAPAIVDSIFAGASFCKWVCPIGQVNFLQSLVSPFEVAVRSPAACATCATHDCLRGRPGARGCELELFLPRKVGSLDCTFCLDCVRACPKDNVGVLATWPIRRLPEVAARPWTGPGSTRLDGTVLATVFVAGGLVAAAAMVAPVAAWRDRWSAALGLDSPAWLGGAGILLTTTLAPLGLLLLVVALGRRLGRPATSARELGGRLSLALVPLGAALWAAHVLFHLVTGWSAAGAVLLRAAGDAWGWAFPGGSWPPPSWSTPGLALGADELLRLQIWLLDAGLLGSLWVGWRAALARAPGPARALALSLPWMVLAVALYGAGVWVFLQPMEMRGMVHG